MPRLAHAVLAARRSEVDLLLEHVESLVADEVNGAAAPAVAARRPHLWLVLLAPESNAPVAAVACLHPDARAVEKEPVRLVVGLVGQSHTVRKLIVHAQLCAKGAVRRTQLLSHERRSRHARCGRPRRGTSSGVGHMRERRQEEHSVTVRLKLDQRRRHSGRGIGIWPYRVPLGRSGEWLLERAAGGLK